MTLTDFSAQGDQPRLLALVATLNEETNLERCLAQLRFADEILVVDSGSTDRTAEIAERYGARVIQFPGVKEAGCLKRNWALRSGLVANVDWVLIVDADEEYTPELAEEIRHTISVTNHDGFYVRYRIYFMGRQLKHAGLAQAMQLRLLRFGTGEYQESWFSHLASTGDVEVHEKVVVSGSVGTLDGYALHYDYRGYENWISKHNRYSTWEAQRRLVREDWKPLVETLQLLVSRHPSKWRAGARSLSYRVPGKPAAYFFWSYVLAGGWRDGRAGLAYCLSMTIYHLQSGYKFAELKDAESGD